MTAPISRDVIAEMPPPQDVSAERVYLGTVLALPEAETMTVLAETEHLAPEDFYRDAHKGIYKALRAQEADGVAPDTRTTVARLGDALTADYGPQQISDLRDHATSVAGAIGIAKHLRSVGQMRRLFNACAETLYEARWAVKEAEVDADEVMGRALKRIEDIAADGAVDEDYHETREILVRVIERLQSDDNTDLYVPTGIQTVDDAYMGAPVGLVTTLAAMPSHGKSTFVIQFARHAAERGEVGAMFSFEDSNEIAVSRYIEQLSGVSAVKLAFGHRDDLVDSEFSLIQNAAGMVMRNTNGGAIYWAHQCRPRLDIIVAKIRLLKRKDGRLRFVVIDYLQFISVLGMKKNSPESIAEIMTELHNAAQQYQVAVILVAQFNRKGADSEDGVPKLGWLYGSSFIEMVSKQIWFLYRPEKYNIGSINMTDLSGQKVTLPTENLTALVAAKVNHQKPNTPDKVPMWFESRFRCYRRDL